MGSVSSLTADSCGGHQELKRLIWLTTSDYSYSRVWFARTSLKWLFIKFPIFRIETINIRPYFDTETCVNPKLHQ